MRGLVILFVLGIVGCIAGIVVVGRMMGDQGVPIAYAFGNPDADTVEMNVVVAMGMVNTERPRVDLETGAVYWDEWADKHFELVDSAGNKVAFLYRTQSSLIPDHKAGGTPEGYLRGRVKKGMAYTFDYIPRIGGKARYRHKFESPVGEQKISRPAFELVK